MPTNTFAKMRFQLNLNDKQYYAMVTDEPKSTYGCGRGKGMGTPAMTPYKEALRVVTVPAGLNSIWI